MLTSSMSMGVVVINSVSFLRQKGGFPPLTIFMRLPLSLLASSAIWSTVITSTMFAVEAERDGLFSPVSNDPSIKTPGKTNSIVTESASKSEEQTLKVEFMLARLSTPQWIETV